MSVPFRPRATTTKDVEHQLDPRVLAFCQTIEKELPDVKVRHDISKNGKHHIIDIILDDHWIVAEVLTSGTRFGFGITSIETCHFGELSHEVYEDGGEHGIPHPVEHAAARVIYLLKNKEFTQGVGP